jgi:hypothetical protein
MEELRLERERASLRLRLDEDRWRVSDELREGAYSEPKMAGGVVARHADVKEGAASLLNETERPS